MNPRIAKPPASMVFQFRPAFVVVVIRQPERFWVTHMNRHGHVQFAAPLPDRIQFRIINANQCTAAIFQKQSEPFEFLESGSPQSMPDFNRHVLKNQLFHPQVEQRTSSHTASLLCSGYIWYFIVSLMMSISLHPLAGHHIAEHVVFVGEAETYSYYGILNKLTWNVGYHNEHHDFPNIPWSRLEALRRMAPECRYWPEKRLISMRSARTIWPN